MLPGCLHPMRGSGWLCVCHVTWQGDVVGSAGGAPAACQPCSTRLTLTALALRPPCPSRRLEELLASAAAEERPSPAALLAQVRTLVDACFGSMLRFSSRQARQAQQEAGAAGEASSGAAGGQPGQLGQPLDLEGLRALLLQHVPVAVADLRRQHVAADEPEERRQLALRFLLELLLRLSICAYGEGCTERGAAEGGQGRAFSSSLQRCFGCPTAAMAAARPCRVRGRACTPARPALTWCLPDAAPLQARGRAAACRRGSTPT